MLLELVGVGVGVDVLFEIENLLLALIVIATADDEDLANVGGLDEVGVVVGFVAFYNGGETEDFERVGLALEDECTLIFTICCCYHWEGRECLYTKGGRKGGEEGRPW